MIDDHFAEIDREFERLVPPLSQSNPELFARLQVARDKIASKELVTIRFLADEDVRADILQGLRFREPAIRDLTLLSSERCQSVAISLFNIGSRLRGRC